MMPIQLVIASISFSLVALFIAIPFVRRFVRPFVKSERSKASITSDYEDADGKATAESIKRYSTVLQHIILGITVTILVAVSLAKAITATLNASINSFLVAEWLTFGISILLLIGFCNIVFERHPVVRFNHAAVEAIAFVVLFAIDIFNIYGTFVLDTSKRHEGPDKLSTVVVWTYTAVHLLGIFACITYPRRPHVYRDGHTVDEQWTVSILYRITHSWSESVLRLPAEGKRLSFDILPVLDHHTRARDLYDAFYQIKDSKSLAMHLIRSHSVAFSLQYAYTLLDALLMFSPQYALYRLIKTLEKREAGINSTKEATFWAAMLGLFAIVANVVNIQLWFISFNRLNTPIRAQIIALVFGKSLRKRDIKSTGAKNTDAESDDDTKEMGAKEEKVMASRQSVINLVGVDVSRIADFASLNLFFPGTIFRLAISFYFLLSLIGWQALLAGLVALVLLSPLNAYTAKKYADAQGQLMTHRDRKVAIVNEALNGIRQIKFSATEGQWYRRIRESRESELRAQWSVFVFHCLLNFCWIMGPVLLSAASISVYALQHDSLPPSVAFTSISIMSSIEISLAVIPEMITHLLDCVVSLKRLSEYLESAEKRDVAIPGDSIEMRGATITWPADEVDPNTFSLKDVSLKFPNEQLSVISGPTGSGKSLMLTAIQGEAEVLKGNLVLPPRLPYYERFDQKANKSNWILPNSMAFVSQEAWLENMSFRDNVLFGLPFDEQRYNKVVKSCALEKDISFLIDGDQTEIGSSGINLSGGQKWRLSLARALYSRAGILLLDDIFAAVDATTGRYLLNEALTGELVQGRTRILATHHVSILHGKMAYEVVLGDGIIKRHGATPVVSDTETPLDTHSNEFIDEPYPDNAGKLGGQRKESVVDHDLILVKSHQSELPDDPHNLVDLDAAPRKFVEEEMREVGHVKWRVYLTYLRANGGFWFWTLLLSTFIFFEVMLLTRSWILRLWTKSAAQSEDHIPDLLLQGQNRQRQTKGIDPNTLFYLYLYVGVSFATGFEGVIRYLTVYIGSIRASRTMFESMISNILYAKLRWLDTVPVGRILNRFSADFKVVDSMLAVAASFGLYNFMLVVGVITAGAFISPIFLLFAVALLILCLRYALYYIVGAREVRRLESIAKSPIFELFGSTLAGIATIRTYDMTPRFMTTMNARIDDYVKTHWYQQLLNRWLTFRLSLTGAAFSLLVSGLIVSIHNIDAALAGFALGFTVQYSEAVTTMLRQVVSIELGMNAAERIVEYSELDTEPETGMDVPASWPSNGALEVDNLSVSYADDLPDSLRDVSFHVEARERVGVVGRTGAGKSSLALALFRFLEAKTGTIAIDGIDISKVKLHDLRSRLAIIPQDPVLFSGTVRSNLDPFDEHEDWELRDALERVHLIGSSGIDTPVAPDPSSSSSSALSGTSTPRTPINTNVFYSVTSPISESGHNLSQGQRQLLCLARALLSRPSILVLDEATSAVDTATDAKIQKSIRENFQGCTLLVIAHRLSTVADFDRILVMSEGRSVEFGRPAELLGRGEEGVFRGLVEESGDREVLKGMILGKGK
ncbi:putative ABC bile acid transporter [Eremomyces bilateralis CBS 781.70]|uniref:ABC bile acid transporter n=1 Tax=Eremomyces bilateralis CBS 781.70 TaxID=1392243 RepID=A0A6G1G1A3_9PEZI|nr:putative ABC bile acid transporter [Eremomyces bilateralis CBS 781.70]KAF1811711.1 putative ABC bile acid transporter [Eremomyces bilateralis CBS 781.70]